MCTCTIYIIDNSILAHQKGGNNKNKPTKNKIMYELFNIQDKVIVITGGTGVLGSSMVEYLAAHGAKIAVLARNKQKGDELINRVKSKGGEAIFCKRTLPMRRYLNKTQKTL